MSKLEKFSEEMDSDPSVSPQFPVDISTNGRRVSNIFAIKLSRLKRKKGIRKGLPSNSTLWPSHPVPASTQYDSETNCLNVLLAVKGAV